MDELENLLNPGEFFRINRQIIVHVSGIRKIENYFNSRLKLKLIPEFGKEVIVSRERCNDFKNWLDQ